MAILVQLIPVGSVLLSGLIAGSMFGTGLSLYSSRGLPEAGWTRRFQLEDALFARVMPPLLQGQLLLSVAATLFEHGMSRVLFAATAILAVGVLAITLGLEVPLNRQIQSWTPGEAPTEWMTVRERWLWNHLYRATAALLAFVCSVLAV